jgi:hypothetical protein
VTGALAGLFGGLRVVSKAWPHKLTPEKKAQHFYPFDAPAYLVKQAFNPINVARAAGSHLGTVGGWLLKQFGKPKGAPAGAVQAAPNLNFTIMMHVTGAAVLAAPSLARRVLSRAGRAAAHPVSSMLLLIGGIMGLDPAIRASKGPSQAEQQVNAAQ